MDTTETIPADAGFALLGTTHILWLLAFVVITVFSCLMYRRFSEKGRRIWRITIAVLLLLDEAFKDVMLVLGGRFLLDYLPLHLCSINIVLIAIHAWKPSKILDGYLYTVGIPGALAALIFPSWTSLPLANFMHLHSFTVHILLAVYPIVLFASGDILPQVKKLPIYLGLLVAMAVPIYGINHLLGTNFMFLMSADPGNPLYLFEQWWGSHLLGFPVIIAGVLIVMYVPLVIIRKLRSK